MIKTYTLLKAGIQSFAFMAILCFISFYSMAQNNTQVSGTVKDQTGEVLIGVSVKAVNSAGGESSVATDKDGRFLFTSLQANATYTFTFSFIGFTTQKTQAYRLAAGKPLTLQIKMQGETTELNQVVVIGYGTSSKKDVTGAVTSVKSEDFNSGVLTTPAQLLQGKVAGLNITKSGDPNQQPTVILRGPSTIRSGAAQTPFYVIDGVPGASIDLLAPADIESIDVLKDASSTAIYGTRAANGVIMVTTKKAKAGQANLTYSAYGAVEQVSKKIDMLSGPELRDYLKANGQTLIPVLNDDGSDTNWQNLVQRNGYSQNHNLSFSGSGTSADYGISANYLKNNGVMKKTSLDRLILRGYVNQRFFKDRLKLGLTITNSTSDIHDIYQSQVLSNMLFYLPTVSPFNPDGSYKEFYGRTGSGTLNPLSLIDNNVIRNKDTKTLINGLAQVDILSGLRFTLSVSSQKNQTNYNTYLNSASGLAVNLGGVASRSTIENTNTIVESYFNYDKIFGRHNFKLLAGYSYQQDRTNDGFGISTQRFSNDEVTYNNLFLSNPSSLSQISFNNLPLSNDNQPISTLRLISFYGRVQYQFADKYLFQASLRNDGSSAFGKNERYGYFPAISAGWRINQEDFLKNVDFLTDLKLRGGYGESGNSAGFNAFTSLLIYGTPPGGSSKFLYNGNITNAIGPVRNDNPNLKWETTATSNFGLDFGFLKNRISGSVDYYIKKTSGLIYDQYPVSTTQYFVPTYTANVGRISNKGIEVVLNLIPVQTDNFVWRTSLNGSHNKNVIDNISNDQFKLNFIQTAQLGGKGQSFLYSQIIQPGLPLGTFNLWHYTGKNAAGVSSYENAAGQIISTQPLSTDVRLAGSAQPKFVYGWNNSFSYKNFDLNFLVRGVTGNKILNGTLAALNNPADSKIQNIPRFTLGESYADINGYLVSDRFLESGSYLRLDNATLGYTLKPKITAIKSLRFYASTNNLFIITKYRGIDPEVNIGGLTPGIDNNNYYPKTRSFIFGLNASF